MQSVISSCLSRCLTVERGSISALQGPDPKVANYANPEQAISKPGLWVLILAGKDVNTNENSHSVAVAKPTNKNHLSHLLAMAQIEVRGEGTSREHATILIPAVYW